MSPLEGASPPLIVTTRFGLGVKDYAWLNHRLTLLSAITAPSLFAQDDQNFYWVIFVDPNVPADIHRRLTDVIAPFGENAILNPNRYYGTRSVRPLAGELGIARQDEWILMGLLDDDDAWSMSVVSEVRERATQWLRAPSSAPGLGITFEYGLEWLMYDMLDVDVVQKRNLRVERKETIRPFYRPFLGTSIFVLSQSSHPVSTLSRGHSRMGEFLTDSGYDVDVVATKRPMWLYCRHKQAGSGIQKSKEGDRKVDLRVLAVEFGVDEEQISEYLKSAGSHGYAIVKRTARERMGLEARLSKLSERATMLADSRERKEVQTEQARLTAELARISEGIVGDPE